MKILLQSNTENKIIEINGMTAVGGESSSGQKLKGLKSKDDYIVVSKQGESLNILSLKVKSKSPILLNKLESFNCKDLRITLLEDKETPKRDTSKTKIDLEQLLKTLTKISEVNSREEVFQVSLNHILDTHAFDRGLIIGLNSKNKYEVVSHSGTDPSSPWLSESLLKETLTKNKPLTISNVIGSPYEKNKSLMATGFTSVSTWPMLSKGKVIGAIIAGSGMPHSGLDKTQSQSIEILSQFIANDTAAFLLRKKLESKIEKSKLVDDSPLTSTYPPIHKMLNLARKASKSDLSIYVNGETGTGKEVLSKWLHSQAFENKAPFIAVNCAAIPENLIESTLFGHKKGSFTGAISDQVGKFTQAHGGTLFLDEVGELSPAAQGKLLRAIQEKVIEPIGSKSPISIQARVIVASHKNLKRMVEEDKFREDLYYRLSEIELQIPPLRDRPADTLLLAKEFLKDNYQDISLSENAKEFLCAQQWKGNVRELLSSMKKAALFCEGNIIEESDFYISQNNSPSEWLTGGSLDTAIKEFQQLKIKEALSRTEGSRTEAAKVLGINLRTLFRHLENIKE